MSKAPKSMTPPAPQGPRTDGLEVAYLPLSALSGYARNARTHSAEQVAEIVASIKTFGWTTPILVDEEREIIAGHGRLAAAQSLGLAEVPTITLRGLTPAQVKALRLADNQLALNSGWDMDLLAAELGELKLEDFDLDVIGFEPEFMATLDAPPQKPAGVSLDDKPKPPPKDAPETCRCPKCGFDFVP